MSTVVFDVTYVEQHNRLTTAFRYILAIPHLVLMNVWGWAAEIVALLQWFVILFTGERNEGLWHVQRSWIGYASRVYGYQYLLHDTWPTFGTMWGAEPVAFGLHYEAKADRLTNALRVIWAIPAAIIVMVLSIAMGFVLIVAWLAILVTGRLPRGMSDFIVRVTRMVLALAAYLLLMTDAYPRYDGAGPTSVLPPGDLDHGGTGPVIGAPPDGDSLPPPSGPPTG
jgi:Domain of unknown function (DUF4389)